MNGPGSAATAAALRANLALLGALETYGAGLLDIIVNLAVTTVPEADAASVSLVRTTASGWERPAPPRPA